MANPSFSINVIDNASAAVRRVSEAMRTLAGRAAEADRAGDRLQRSLTGLRADVNALRAAHGRGNAATAQAAMKYYQAAAAADSLDREMKAATKSTVGYASATRIADQRTINLARGLSALNGQLATSTVRMGAFSKVTASVFGTGLLVRGALQVSNTAREYEKLAAATGGTPGLIADISQTARENFVTLGEVQTVLASIYDAQQEALTGDTARVQQFSALNVSLEDLRNLNTDEILLRLKDGFDAAGGSAEASRAETDLFRRNVLVAYKQIGDVRRRNRSEEIATAAELGEEWAKFQTNVERTAIRSLTEVRDLLSDIDGILEGLPDGIITTIRHVLVGDEEGDDIPYGAPRQPGEEWYEAVARNLYDLVRGDTTPASPPNFTPGGISSSESQLIREIQRGDFSTLFGPFREAEKLIREGTRRALADAGLTLQQAANKFDLKPASEDFEFELNEALRKAADEFQTRMSTITVRDFLSGEQIRALEGLRVAAAYAPSPSTLISPAASIIQSEIDLALSNRARGIDTEPEPTTPTRVRDLGPQRRRAAYNLTNQQYEADLAEAIKAGNFDVARELAVNARDLERFLAGFEETSEETALRQFNADQDYANTLQHITDSAARKAEEQRDREISLLEQIEKTTLRQEQLDLDLLEHLAGAEQVGANAIRRLIDRGALGEEAADQIESLEAFQDYASIAGFVATNLARQEGVTDPNELSAIYGDAFRGVLGNQNSPEDLLLGSGELLLQQGFASLDRLLRKEPLAVRVVNSAEVTIRYEDGGFSATSNNDFGRNIAQEVVGALQGQNFLAPREYEGRQ